MKRGEDAALMLNRSSESPDRPARGADHKSDHALCLRYARVSFVVGHAIARRHLNLDICGRRGRSEYERACVPLPARFLDSLAFSNSL